MILPLPTNVTCDVYESGRQPPAAPDVAGLAGNLQPWPRNIHTTPHRYTHWLDVPLATVPVAALGGFLYVPNKGGTKFLRNCATINCPKAALLFRCG